MKLKLFAIISAVLLTTTACNNKDNGKTDPIAGHTNDEMKMNGDKTVYGLACEGCNDSTILLLPNDGSDPIKYDIIDAYNKKRVLGSIHVGELDWCCFEQTRQACCRRSYQSRRIKRNMVLRGHAKDAQLRKHEQKTSKAYNEKYA